MLSNRFFDKQEVDDCEPSFDPSSCIFVISLPFYLVAYYLLIDVENTNVQVVGIICFDLCKTFHFSLL